MRSFLCESQSDTPILTWKQNTSCEARPKIRNKETAASLTGQVITLKTAPGMSYMLLRLYISCKILTLYASGLAASSFKPVERMCSRMRFKCGLQRSLRWYRYPVPVEAFAVLTQSYILYGVSRLGCFILARKCNDFLTGSLLIAGVLPWCSQYSTGISDLSTNTVNRMTHFLKDLYREIYSREPDEFLEDHSVPRKLARSAENGISPLAPESARSC